MLNIFLIIFTSCFGAILVASSAQAGPLTRGRWSAECINRGGRLQEIMRDGRTFIYCNTDHLDPEVTPPFDVDQYEVRPGDTDATVISPVNINPPQHDDQIVDPFRGKFISDSSIFSFGSGASSTLNLNLDTNSSSLYLIGPEIWGEPTLRPNVINGRISLERNAVSGEIQLQDFLIQYDSFSINGVDSGINTISLAPQKKYSFNINPTTGTIELKVEAITSNNLYSVDINPILNFGIAQGKILSDNEIEFVTSTNDPGIVPGVPGKPPINNLGMAYIATIASFNSQTSLLTFNDNLNNVLMPDISIVRSFDGQYFSRPTNAENLVGASYEIEPLQFLRTELGRDSFRKYFFSDARFLLSNSEGVFASGLLTNINIETNFYSFSGDVVLDKNQDFLPSPFMNIWRSNPTIQLLGPLGTESLISFTNRFTHDGTSNIDFTNLEPKVPEPSSILGLLALGSLGTGLTLKRKLKQSKSTTKETTKVG